MMGKSFDAPTLPRYATMGGAKNRGCRRGSGKRLAINLSRSWF
jgi:hypothetical protein